MIKMTMRKMILQERGMRQIRFLLAMSLNFTTMDRMIITVITKW